MALAEARRMLSRRKGVVSIHWARKTVDGRTTPTVAVTVVVEAKLPPDAVPPKSRIPATITVRSPAGTVQVPTDVVELQAATKQGLRILPGGRTTARGRRQGLVSAVRLDETTARVYVSGHVAGAEGTIVNVGTGAAQRRLGIARPCRDDEWTDSAVVGGVSPTLAKTLGADVSEVRDVDRDDIGLPVFVTLARKAEPIRTTVHGLPQRTPFTDGKVMRDLIELEEAVTIGGDSGAPVADRKGRVVGFVVGANSRRTYVLPAKRGLDV